MSPTIRDAHDDDGDALLLVLGAVFAEYPGCLMERGEYPELSYPRSSFTRAGGRLWVVEDERGVAGCVGIGAPHGDGLAELKKLYLLPRLRGTGLGKALVARVEDEARKQGASGTHLWSDTRFKTAHAVYERCGYTRSPGVRALGDISQSLEYHYAKRW